MSIADYEKAIEKAVEESMAESSETISEDKTNETIESTGEGTEDHEVGNSEIQDGPERNEGDEDRVATEAETEEDSGESATVGESGEEASGEDRSVEAEQKPFLSFKDQEEFFAFMEQVKDKQESQQQDKSADKSEQDNLLASLPELDPEVYDENLIGAFNQMKSVIQQQQQAIGDFQKQYETLNNSIQQNIREDITKKFDEKIASLGEDFHDALGVGRMAELPPNSAQHQKRDQIAAKMAVLAAGYQHIGQGTPSFDDLFQEASSSVLADDILAVKQKKIGATLEKREKGHIQRPGGSKQKGKKSPEDEVADLLRERYGDHFRNDGW